MVFSYKCPGTCPSGFAIKPHQLPARLSATFDYQMDQPMITDHGWLHCRMEISHSINLN